MHTKKPLPCLLSRHTLDELQARYPYMFDVQKISAKLIPRLELHVLEKLEGSTIFLEFPIQFTSYMQQGMQVTGFRIGDFAYFSDLKDYSDTIFDSLQGVNTLVISALRFDPSHGHLTVDEAIAFAERSGASHTWLTHIAHELDHEKTNAYLPPNVRMAYDGLEVKFYARTNSEITQKERS